MRKAAKKGAGGRQAGAGEAELKRWLAQAGYILAMEGQGDAAWDTPPCASRAATPSG